MRECPVCLAHRPEAMRARTFSLDRAPKSASFSTLLRILQSQSPRRPTDESCLMRRTLEEAATPGQPARAEARFWNPPSNSPSRTAGNRRRFHDAPARPLRYSRLCESNVPEDLNELKKKVRLVCAEAVEDEDFLWKLPEKLSRKLATDSTESNPCQSVAKINRARRP
jgi:hypothetical protein